MYKDTSDNYKLKMLIAHNVKFNNYIKLASMLIAASLIYYSINSYVQYKKEFILLEQNTGQAMIHQIAEEFRKSFQT